MPNRNVRQIDIKKPLVSVEWLLQNLDAPNLIILDASIQKVGEAKSEPQLMARTQIKDSRFFDLKMKFSDLTSEFPNTMQVPSEFSESARQLGINKNSAIVVYDDLGIYSSPRVWWMFKAMGHPNIAVLNGGLPEWKQKGMPVEKNKIYKGEHGDFTADYNPDLMSDYKDVLNSIKIERTLVIDARSENRFNGTEPEPRVGLRSGHIPNSSNLPYTELIKNGKMIDREKLLENFSKFDAIQDRFVFTCGSGITASILALGAEIAGLHNNAVYDGSWTEWGSITELPIE